MTTRYVDGTNGNNAWDGLAPNFVAGTNGPKATFNGAEDTPVTPGDVVHVRPGTYREQLTCDVSGTIGNPIEYRGDYRGLIWPGGGEVRITGSNDDLTQTRISCITILSKNYRNFQWFLVDSTVTQLVDLNTAATDIGFDRCIFVQNSSNVYGIRGQFTGTQARHRITNCTFWGSHAVAIWINQSTVIDFNADHLIENCIFQGGVNNGGDVYIERVGGIMVRNCDFLRGGTSVRVVTSPFAGRITTVNNCIFNGGSTGVRAAVLGELIEDHNNFYGMQTNRTNVAVGANSVSYPPYYDYRSLFETMRGSRLSSPMDLASYNQLVNRAGTAPPAADMRGSTIIGAQREYGALEYDPTLLVASGGGGNVFGGTVVR